MGNKSGKVEELVMESIIRGVNLIDIPGAPDSRGQFRRLADSNWIPENFEIMQTSFSENIQAGTLRGLHYQKDQSSEYKIVSLIRGSIFDVLLDLRKNSATYKMVSTRKLTAENPQAMVIPPGIAHGFLTLEPNTLIYYAMSAKFDKENYSGVRWDDPTIKIDWPFSPEVISGQDRVWPLLNFEV